MDPGCDSENIKSGTDQIVPCVKGMDALKPALLYLPGLEGTVDHFLHFGLFPYS
jgi:hypothetical protein